MFSDIVINFQNITKFQILTYFTDFKNFMQNDFPEISSYFSGKESTLSSEKIFNLNSLIKRSKLLLQQFINFSNKLSNCGYWELQQYCQDLNDTLEKITKLPKYQRTSKSYRGYTPFIRVNTNIGGMKTIEDVSREINSPGVDELSLIINNDLEEQDWEINKLSSIYACIDNTTDVVVTTILEQPINEKIYGKDISKKIKFVENDVEIKAYKENIDQKCLILLNLNKGDIPEIPFLGKNISFGKNVSDYNYVEFLKDIKSNFSQDDLFDSIEISEISFQNGDIIVSCNIKTKYSYSTTKKIKI